jgi:hypothetical protein
MPHGGLPAASYGAIVVHGTKGRGRGRRGSDSDSPPDSSDDERAYRVPTGPPGPADPRRCKVKGPGFQGAAAQQPVNLYVHAHDEYGRRCKEGGEAVEVRVGPASSSMHLDGPIEVSIVDNGNGIYTATYTAPVKGNYTIGIELNGLPVNGSPFPVFFANPIDPSLAQPATNEAAGEPGEGGAKGAPPGGPNAAAAAAAAAAGGNPIAAAAQAAAIAAMGGRLDPSVSAPSAEEIAQRTVYASNLSPTLALDQLKTLFSITGKVRAPVPPPPHAPTLPTPTLPP